MISLISGNLTRCCGDIRGCGDVVILTWGLRASLKLEAPESHAFPKGL